MPQFLVPVIIAIGEVVGVTVTAVAAGYIAAGIVLLGTLAYSSYQKKKAERAQRAATDASAVDRFANVPATTASRELVMGRLRKGGNIFFRGSAGGAKQIFAFAMTLAAHEIDGIEQVYFNDQPITLDGAGNVTSQPFARYTNNSVNEPLGTTVYTMAGNPVDGSLQVLRSYGDQVQGTWQQEAVPFTVSGLTVTIGALDPQWSYTIGYQYVTFNSLANVHWHLGVPGQGPDARLMALFPGIWTANSVAEGVAYLVCEFIYADSALPSGLPNVTALIRGAKIYDPRTTLTVFSECPALMMRHVAAHPYFGKRTSFTAAEEARFSSEANVCEAAVNYGGGVVSRYRAAVVVPFGAPPRDVLDDLSMAMGGQWAYAAGEIYLKAGMYTAPVMALSDADLATVARSNDGSTSQNPITIATHKPRADKVNSIVARIWDQAAGYVMTPIAPQRSAAYVAADGAELVQEVTLPAVFDAYQAWAIAGIMLRDSRDPLTVTLTFKLTAYPLELFDGVYLSLPRYGWVAKEFQILARVFNPEGTITLTLKETSYLITNFSAGFVPGGFASNSTLPLPWVVPVPVIQSVQSGDAQLVVQSDGTIANGVAVTWSQIQDAAVQSPTGSIELQWCRAADGIWRSLIVPGDATSAVIIGPGDLEWIAVRLRCRTSLASGDWSAQIWHQVIGKSAPPPDISVLTIAGAVLSWSLPFAPADLAGAVFRFHYGNNEDWGSAAPMHAGVITQSPFNLVTRPSGVVTILAKAIDTSGNLSANAAVIVMNLGDQTIVNVVAQTDFNAIGWPYAAGLQVNWTLVGGLPTAGALDSFYGANAASFYGADGTSFYDASAYGAMQYVSPEVPVTGVLVGSLLTLTIQAQGADLILEYRKTGPTPFYGGADADAFYGPDADPFYEAPGPWLPWPGQIVAANDVYQFRVSIGAGTVQGILQALVMTIDAPDINETISNLVVAAGGTVVPYTRNFTAIKAVQATLQANLSGAVTLEIDKSSPLAPIVRAYNVSHTAVSGATVDLVVQGY